MNKAIPDIKLSIPLVTIALILFLSACASPPPADTSNVCSIFKERHSWYKAAQKSEKRWGVSIGVNMAVIMQESSFNNRAKPPRKYYFGFIPGPRPSDAFGFAQALEATWDEYKEQAGNWGARRSSFSDAIDFVGWYNNRSTKLNSISGNDPYNLYLAYHEGNGGFAKRSYQDKDWLKQSARRVQDNSGRYQQQLQGCQRDLNRNWFMRLFF